MNTQIEKIDAKKKNPDEVRCMFASIAHRYDLLNHLLSLSLDISWRRMAVKLAEVRPGSNVLDACAGTCDLALAFRAKLAGRGKVIATDVTPEMLELGRKKLGATCGNGLGFALADTLNLPAADESFDVISVAFGVRNLENTGEGFREIARVLKSGGRAIILEFAPPRSPVMKKLYGFYLRRVLPFVGRIISGSKIDAYRYLADTISGFLGPEEMVKIMRDSGFGRVTVHALSCGIVNIYRGVK